MKAELIKAHEEVSKAYVELRDNPQLVAPQFDNLLVKLAVILMDLNKAIDVAVESEQINSGLN